MLLACDIGGTKVTVALGEERGGAIFLDEVTRHASADYPDLAALLAKVVAGRPLSSAGIGVAGPVLGRQAQLTNLPWVIDADLLETALGCPVALMNDLEAHGWGIAQVNEADLVPLQRGRARPGNRALIAAGTGLGEAILFWNGQEHVPSASEGGHTDFAPGNLAEIELLRFLFTRYDHVSWERIVSGADGFNNLIDFLAATGRITIPPEHVADLAVAREVGPIITAAANTGEPYARTVLEWFARLYGAEAGNLALKSLAVGGVYLSGGIALKILPFLQTGAFNNGFRSKGRFEGLLAEIPVYVVRDELTALRGAAWVANRIDRDGTSKSTSGSHLN